MSIAPINRRKDIRRTLPVLMIQLGDLRFPTRDWSLGGFALTGATYLGRPLEIGEVIFGHLGRPDEPIQEDATFHAEVRRFAENGDLAGCSYTQLTTEAFTFLERLMRRAQPSRPTNDTSGDNRLRRIFRRPIEAFSSSNRRE